MTETSRLLDPTRHLVLAVLAVAAVIASGTLGYILIEGWPAFDAFYMTALGMMFAISAYFSPDNRAAVYAAFIWEVITVFTRAMDFATGKKRGPAVVAFATGGIPDWLEDGVTGVLARPGDPASLAAGMQRLLDDPGLSQAMGRAGRESVAQNFSHRRFLDAMESVIREAIALRRDSLPDALHIANNRLA